MTVTSFFGYLLLSCGPPLVAGVPFFWHRSLLSLTVITSMFAWLLLLIVTSMLFRGFVPIKDEQGPYAGLLVFSVAVEEAFRIGLWWMHKQASVKLRELATTASVNYTEIDELALAYSIGWGHGAVHMMMQFLPFLPLTTEEATLYDKQCPSISLYTLACLSQLGIFGLLAGGHIIFIYGCRFKVRSMAAAIPVLHFSAALLTLLNFKRNGCLVVVPVLICVGSVTAIAAAGLVWKRGTRLAPLFGVSTGQPPTSGASSHRRLTASDRQLTASGRSQ